MDLSSQSKSKILILTSAYQPLIGGSELAIEQVLAHLSLNYTFDIVTPRYNKKHDKIEKNNNSTIHRIGPSGKLSKWLFPIMGWLYVRKLIKSNNYKAIHVWQASYAGGVAWMLRRFSDIDIPIILTIQEGKELDNQSWFVRFFRKRVINIADQITVISNHLKAYVKKQRQDVDIILIPNGVDINRFINDDTQKTNEIKIIMTTSRLIYKNGHDDLIRACIYFEKPYKLLIAGTGPNEAMLRDLTKELKLTDNIVFLGDIPNKEVPRYLHEADVFIRPSRSEGLGISFLEAMASGVPIIAPLVGGISDFLIDGQTGIACNANDPMSVAKAFNSLINDNELRLRITHNAFELIKNQYQWDGIAKQYQALYEQA